MKAQPHEEDNGIDGRSPASRPIIEIGSRSVGGSSLRPTIRRLNERGLDLLTKAAQLGHWADGPASWKEVSQLWARASETTLTRAARCPMVLLDFNFQRVAWWRRMINTQLSGDSALPSLSVFHTQEAISLAHDLLLEAWSAARSLSRVSSLAFGMAPEVTTLIAQLSPRDIDQLVVNEIEDLRLRWENRPMFWRELFHAAAQMDDQGLGNVHLHCLQLLGGELSSSSRANVAGAELGSLSDARR
jgi:hypothetical protein